jgi:hypothetical protein
LSIPILNNKLKILFGIGTVCVMPDPNRWLLSFIRVFDEIKSMGIFEVGVSFVYRRPAWEAQTLLMENAFDKGYDYLLLMDDDIWGVPPGAFGNLYNAQKEFISAVMPVKTYPMHYVKLVKINPKDKRTLQEIALCEVPQMRVIEEKGVQPVDLTAFPLVLFKVSMFKHLSRPYVKYDARGIPPDSIFCQECKDAGIQPFVISDLLLCHGEITPDNRDALREAEAKRLFKLGRLPKYDPIYEAIEELVNKEVLTADE